MKRKSLFVLSGILILGMLIILLFYKEDDIGLLPSYKTSFMKSLRLTHKEGNEAKWELVAQEATIPEDGEEIFINSLRLTIFNDPEIYLSGGSGIYMVEKSNIIINKPVEINIGDAKFTTDTLTWDSKNGLITTDDHIRFRGKKFLIEGKGLTAETKLHKVMILSDVKGIFYL